MFFRSLIFVIINNQNYRLVACFVAYLVVILIFAELYHRIYRANINSFFTPEHLREDRRGESLEELTRDSASIDTRISFLTALREALQSGTARMSPDPEGVMAMLPDGRRGLFRWFEAYEPDRPPSAPAPPAFLVVYDPSGSEIAHGFVEGTGEPPTETEDAVQYIAHHLQDLQSMLRTCVNRRLQLESGSPPWSRFDFFYFSLITQTTVGYGDILPNCTKVRKLVALQVVLGLALLVVIINLTIAR